MTCLYAPLAFLREETCFVKAIGVAYGEGAILSGQMMASGVVDVLVEFAMVLTMVSDAHDEAVEMQNDRPKESDGAREICHDDLHVRDPVLLQVCKHRARGSVGRLFVDCYMSVVFSMFEHHATHGGDRESRLGGPLSKSLPHPLRSLPRYRPPPPRPRSGRSERSVSRKVSIIAFCACSSARLASAAALESCGLGQ